VCRLFIRKEIDQIFIFLHFPFISRFSHEYIPRSRGDVSFLSAHVMSDSSGKKKHAESTWTEQRTQQSITNSISFRNAAPGSLSVK
jgi:hypothetical protein